MDCDEPKSAFANRYMCEHLREHHSFVTLNHSIDHNPCVVLDTLTSASEEMESRLRHLSKRNRCFVPTRHSGQSIGSTDDISPRSQCSIDLSTRTHHFLTRQHLEFHVTTMQGSFTYVAGLSFIFIWQSGTNLLQTKYSFKVFPTLECTVYITLPCGMSWSHALFKDR